VKKVFHKVMTPRDKSLRFGITEFYRALRPRQREIHILNP